TSVEGSHNRSRTPRGANRFGPLSKHQPQVGAPHRTGLAIFPHPALRFVVPLGTVVTCNIYQFSGGGWLREGLILQASHETLFGKAPLLAAPIEPLEQGLGGDPVEVGELRLVEGDAKVLIVTSELGGCPVPERGEFLAITPGLDPMLERHHALV